MSILKLAATAAVAAACLAGSAQAAETYTIDFEGLTPGGGLEWLGPGFVRFMLNEWIEVDAHLINNTDPNFVGDGAQAADWFVIGSIDRRILYLDSFDAFRPGDTTDPWSFPLTSNLGFTPQFTIPSGDVGASFAWPSSDRISYVRFFEFGDGTQFDNIVVHTDRGSVPEPATWAMMIAGFGLVGSTLRRNRRALA